MHIVITGGGTGGHVFPALEIIKEIKNKYPNIRTTYVGNIKSLEQRLALSQKIDFFAINAKQLSAKSFAKKIQAIFFLKIAVFKCILFILNNKVDAIIGVGGFVSAPMLIAGFFQRVKCFICEQNFHPGMANRLFGHIAKKIFISFADSKKYFNPKKVILSGNPVREDFFKGQYFFDGTLRILITGGSLGAQIFNNEIPKAFASLKERCNDIIITHQCGKNDIQKVKSLYEGFKINASVKEFIEDMPKEFGRHNLVISRAGATIIAEISAFGMPSILIPYPYAKGHQKYNALALSNNNCAILVEQDDNLTSRIADIILSLYENTEELKKMSSRVRALGKSGAASTIVDSVVKEIPSL